VLSRAIEKLVSASNMIQGRSMAFLVLVVASLGMLSCSGVLPESTTPSAVAEQQVTLPQPVEEMRDLTIVEKAALADGFAAGFQNPDSVKFRWAKVPKALNAHSFDYCGLLVVKKASGPPNIKPFLATITTEGGSITGGAIAAVSSDDREEHRDIVPKLCGQKGLNPFDAK
jgi:hypothetical protein